MLFLKGFAHDGQNVIHLIAYALHLCLKCERLQQRGNLFAYAGALEESADFVGFFCISLEINDVTLIDNGERHRDACRQILLVLCLC